MQRLLEKYVRKCPFAVMTRTLAQAFLGDELDDVFDQHREYQYESQLKFSALATSVADVTLKFCENLNQAYRDHKEELAVAVTSYYEKVRCIRPALSEAVVRHSAEKAIELQDALDCRPWQVLRGYECFDVDGNHLPRTDKRLKALHDSPGAPLPGKVVARFNLQRQIFDRTYLLTDAHDQELAVCDRLVEDLKAKDVLIADRHYCIIEFFEKIAAASGFFVIRHHGRLKGELVGKRKRIGKVETGVAYEQTMKLRRADDSMRVRRITVELFQPTREGDQEIHVLSNLPADVDALQIAELYRYRWEEETAFHILRMTLTCETPSLGHPHAALFLFCMAMLAFNLRQVIFASLYAEHSEEMVAEVSHFHLSVNVSRYTDGMLVALDREFWDQYVPAETDELAELLRELSREIDLSEFRKSRRGPKKKIPKRSKNAQSKHVSTAKRLKLKTQKDP
jgi:Transposase DDE domain